MSVAAAAAALAVVFLPGVPAVAGVVVGIPFVLVVPGYAVVSCLFPRAGETTPRADGRTAWTSRLALSVGASVGAVGAVAGVLDFTVWGFGRESVAAGLVAVTVLAAAVAAYRRGRAPAEARVSVPLSGLLDRARSVGVGGGPAGVLLTVVVVVAAVGAAGVVAEEATSSAPTTELFVLGSDGTDTGADGAYPTNLTVDRPTDVTVGVGVSGSRGLDGTVVGHLERVAVDGDAVTVTRRWEVARFDVSVGGDERTLVDHAVTPPRPGERLRLTYRLYEEGAERPVRQVHVWVSVAAPDS